MFVWIVILVSKHTGMESIVQVVAENYVSAFNAAKETRNIPSNWFVQACEVDYEVVTLESQIALWRERDIDAWSRQCAMAAFTPGLPA